MSQMTFPILLGLKHLFSNLFLQAYECKRQKEICILFEQTFTIADEALNGLKLPRCKLHITTSEQKKDNLTSEVEVYKLASKFQKVMDDLTQVLVVHLFIAAPAPVSFALGQSISKTMHPKVIVYSYQKNKLPSYTQAFVLNK